MTIKSEYLRVILMGINVPAEDVIGHFRVRILTLIPQIRITKSMAMLDLTISENIYSRGISMALSNAY